MSDPIEQAWRLYDTVVMRGAEEGWTDAARRTANVRQKLVEQAIIRSHPDVIGLAAAARRMANAQSSIVAFGVRGGKTELSLAWNDVMIALAPFEEKAE